MQFASGINLVITGYDFHIPTDLLVFILKNKVTTSVASKRRNRVLHRPIGVVTCRFYKQLKRCTEPCPALLSMLAVLLQFCGLGDVGCLGRVFGFLLHHILDLELLRDPEGRDPLFCLRSSGPPSVKASVLSSSLKPSGRGLHSPLRSSDLVTQWHLSWNL